MRLILPISAILLLVASAWLAPKLHSERQNASAGPKFGIDDPKERAAAGEREKALGLMLRGYEEILLKDPSDIEAARGFVRGGVILSAVSLGQRDVRHVVMAATQVYANNAKLIDPDGDLMERIIQEWIAIRRANSWFLAHASIDIWMASRDVKESQDTLVAFVQKKMGPFWREYFPYCQRHLPSWCGVEPMIRVCLEEGELAAQVNAAVTLMMYRRIYGLGEELWQKHKRAIGAALIQAKSAMTPNADVRSGGSVGGQVLLGLALYDDPTTQRIIARLKPIEHPYLGRIVTVAQCWSGAIPLESIDFEDRRYNVWYPETREFYFRGVMLRYKRLIEQNKLEEAKKLYDSRVELALISGTTDIRIFSHRVLAATHPERSVELHKSLLDAGGISSVYGVHGVPGASLAETSLPALSAPDPGFTALAAVGLCRLDGPPPIQLPVAKQ
jgi:hypothetical protein